MAFTFGGYVGVIIEVHCRQRKNRGITIFRNVKYLYLPLLYTLTAVYYARYIYCSTYSFVQIMLYEGIAEIVKSGKDPTNARELAMTGFEDLVIGGAAGGIPFGWKCMMENLKRVVSDFSLLNFLLYGCFPTLNTQMIYGAIENVNSWQSYKICARILSDMFVPGE
jgi:hypothetical protein